MEEQIRQLIKNYSNRIDSIGWLLKPISNEQDKVPLNTEKECYKVFINELRGILTPKPYETPEYMNLSIELEKLYKLNVKTVTTQKSIHEIELRLQQIKKDFK